MTECRAAALAGVFALSLGLATAAVAETSAERNPMEGGAPVYPYRNIVENAASSKNHSMLLAAVKAAGLEQTLEGPGPFTVFAPTNEAFEKLPPGTVATLLRPENKAALVKVLTYHVVAGKLTEARLRSAIKAGGGEATLTTLEGESLTASLYDDKIVLTDAQGGTAHIVVGNVIQSNGLIDVIDAGLMP